MPTAKGRKAGDRSPVVVVVDDDVAVRNSLKFSLELEGFAVRLYADAHALLDDSELPSFGCLLIDQHMPGMTGLQLLAELRSRSVTLPALLITGHPAPDLPRRAAEFGVPLLEKPLLGNGLLEAIHEALNENRESA